MQIEITYNNQTETFDLAALGEQHSGVITIGQKCKQVWNAIALDDPSVDPFQCHLLGCGESWSLKSGQNRTECPKGLISDRLVPCSNCMGRCVNVRPGRPKYLNRIPQTPTLLNGNPVAEYGSSLQANDLITFGNVTIRVL